MRGWALPTSLITLLASVALGAGAVSATAADGGPDPVLLDVSVSIGTFQTQRNPRTQSGESLASDEPVSVEIQVGGEPMSLSNTSPRTVMLAAGEPVTLRLVDPGPDHVLTAITCLDDGGGPPDPVAFDLAAGSVTLGSPQDELSCEFRLDDAALAGQITLAVEGMPADPAAEIDFLLDTGRQIIEPISVTPDGPRTFPVMPIPGELRSDFDFLPRFTIHGFEPAAPYELAGFRCLDQHGQAVDMIDDPATAVPVAQGSVPARDVAVGLQPGGQATCTASVVRTADLPGAATVRVLTRPLLLGAAHDLDTIFELEIDGETVLLGAAVPHLVRPPSGADETTIELLDPGPDHELFDIECVRRDGSEPAPYEPDVATGSVTVGLAATDTVDCIYRLMEPDPVLLDVSVSIGTFQTQRNPRTQSGESLASDEPVSVEIQVGGEPMSLSNTSPRTVMLAAGEPVTLRLVDPGPDHVLTAITCLDDGGGPPDPVAFDLAAGSVTLGSPQDELSCEFRLDDAALAGQITLAVEGMPADPAAEIDFLLDTGRQIIEPISVTPDGPRTFPVMPIPGELRSDFDFLPRFTIHGFEPAAPYELAGFRCLDQHGQAVDMIDDPATAVPVAQGSVPARDVAVGLQPGGQATCTASVVRTADLPGAATVRVLTRPLLLGAAHDLDTIFELEIDGETVLLGAAVPHLVRPPSGADETTIELLDPGPDHELFDIECVRRDGSEPAPYEPDVATGSVTVGLAATDTVDCIYRLMEPTARRQESEAVTSEVSPERSRATVRLALEPPGKERTAAFEGAHEGTIGHGVGIEGELASGSHVTSMTGMPDGYVLDAVDCDDEDSESGSIGNVERRTATFRLEPGENVTCTFHLTIPSETDRSIRAPKAGPWNSVNARGSIACGGFTQGIPRTTDKGRLQVKQGGRQLVGTSLGDSGRSKLVLRHDDAKPGTWRGKLKTRQQGVSMTLTYVVEMVNDERLNGNLSAKFKAGGQSCKLGRKFTLTYAGK